MVAVDDVNSSRCQWKQGLMAAAANGIFATAVNADDGMVAAASTATAQLTTTTAIAAATTS
jgi:hypothetical protein